MLTFQHTSSPVTFKLIRLRTLILSMDHEALYLFITNLKTLYPIGILKGL